MDSEVTFTLSPRVSGYVLEVRIAGNLPEYFESLPLTEKRMDSLRQELRDCLIVIDQKIKQVLEHSWTAGSTRQEIVVTDLSALKLVHSRLSEFSNLFLNIVFRPHDRKQIVTALGELRKRGLGGLLGRDKPEPVARIDYKADVERLLPIEYLFLDSDPDSNRCVLDASVEPPRELSIDAPGEPSAIATEVATCFSRFLGYAFNVRRIPGNHTSPGVQNVVAIPCHRKQRLVIQFYPLEALSYVKEELAFLMEHTHVFQTKVCELGSDEDQAVKNVARSLGQSPKAPVHHFACHFTPVQNGGCFELGHDQDKFRVEVSKLAAAGCQEPCSDSWIAFINACESGNDTTFDRGGLVPTFFDVFGPSCLIGPENKVMERFAFEFAKDFYVNWLEHRDLGLALFKTRWSLIKRYNNPMGLFYTYFATKQIRLEGDPLSEFI